MSDVFNAGGNGKIRGATSAGIFQKFVQGWTEPAESIHVSDKQGDGPADEYDGIIYGRDIDRGAITLLIHVADGERQVILPYSRDLPVTVENQGDILILTQGDQVVTLTKGVK